MDKNSEIEMFDKVILKNGLTAYIVEILGNHEMYIADIDYPDGTETEDILPSDIQTICK